MTPYRSLWTGLKFAQLLLRRAKSNNCSSAHGELISDGTEAAHSGKKIGRTEITEPRSFKEGNSHQLSINPAAGNKMSSRLLNRAPHCARLHSELAHFISQSPGINSQSDFHASLFPERDKKPITAIQSLPILHSVYF